MVSHNFKEDRTDDVVLDKDYTFEKMLLPEEILKGLTEAGFIYPSMIQKKGIPIGRCGYDLLVQSKSGTGKTLVFSIIALEKYRQDIKMPQTLILAPTREIAVQTADTLKEIGKYVPGFKTAVVIGGLSIQDNRRDLQGCSVVVGTPGRILHLVELQVLNMKSINLLILDEIDQLTDLNFNLSKLIELLPKEIQTISASATLDPETEEKIKKFTRNPIGISPAREIPVLVGIGQFVCQLPPEPGVEMLRKFKKLKEILSSVTFKQCFIFTNSQSLAESYKKLLVQESWPSEVITGAYEQSQRLTILRKLKEFKIRVLLSTDLMARGIDSENVNLVINMDVPRNGMVYLHRIGRAGRFGTKGIAITLVATEKQREEFDQIQDQFGMTGVMELPEKLNSDAIWELVDKPKVENRKKVKNVVEEKKTKDVDTLALLLDSSCLDQEEKKDEQRDKKVSMDIFKEFEQFSETEVPEEEIEEKEMDPEVKFEVSSSSDDSVLKETINCNLNVSFAPVQPPVRNDSNDISPRKPQRKTKKLSSITPHCVPERGLTHWESMFYSQYAMINNFVQSNRSYSKNFPRY